MCEPITLSTMATAAAVAGSAVSAYAAIRSGSAQKAAADYNARAAREEAARVEKQRAVLEENAALDQRRLAERVRAEMGDQIARAAAMGLDPSFGTPADLVGDIATAGRVDASIINRNLDAARADIDAQARTLRSGAAFEATMGKEAQTAGYLQGAGFALGAVTPMARAFDNKKFTRFEPTPVTGLPAPKPQTPAPKPRAALVLPIG